MDEDLVKVLDEWMRTSKRGESFSFRAHRKLLSLTIDDEDAIIDPSYSED